mmetsp:Transcript_14242/g.30505  ORF Transcript_14242/g.30505 Transcript_14242/m.30505 type:complete len:322 (-) Transcript_14242:686-1651(-)
MYTLHATRYIFALLVPPPEVHRLLLGLELVEDGLLLLALVVLGGPPAGRALWHARGGALYGLHPGGGGRAVRRHRPVRARPVGAVRAALRLVREREGVDDGGRVQRPPVEHREGEVAAVKVHHLVHDGHGAQGLRQVRALVPQHKLVALGDDLHDGVELGEPAAVLLRRLQHGGDAGQPEDLLQLVALLPPRLRPHQLVRLVSERLGLDEGVPVDAVPEHAVHEAVGVGRRHARAHAHRHLRLDGPCDGHRAAHGDAGEADADARVALRGPPAHGARLAARRHQRRHEVLHSGDVVLRLVLRAALAVERKRHRDGGDACLR